MGSPVPEHEVQALPAHAGTALIIELERGIEPWALMLWAGEDDKSTARAWLLAQGLAPAAFQRNVHRALAARTSMVVVGAALCKLTRWAWVREVGGRLGASMMGMQVRTAVIQS